MKDRKTQDNPRLLSIAVMRQAGRYVLPFLGLLLVAVLVLHSRDLNDELKLGQGRALHAVNSMHRAIQHELETARSDLRFLSQQAKLREYLSTGGGRAGLEEEYRLFVEKKTRYHQVRLLGIDGRERIRINNDGGQANIVPEASLQTKADRYYLQQILETEPSRTYVSPFDLNVEHGEIETPWRPVIRVGTPVFDADRQKRGILVVNILGQPLLDRLNIFSPHTPWASILVSGQGYYLIGPDKDRSWGFMFGAAPTFAADHPDAWTALNDASEGQVVNAQGLLAFSTLGGGEDTDLSEMMRRLDIKLVTLIPTETLRSQSELALVRFIWISAIAAIVFLVLVLYLQREALIRRVHQRNIADSENRLRLLSSQLLRSQEDERRTIARDLHDEMGQVVTAISLQMQRAVETEETDKKDILIGQAISAAEHLLEHVHLIVSRLRPNILDDFGLEAALDTYLRDYEQATGVHVEAELHLPEETIPQEVSDNVYRIIQEALTNISEHADTQTAWVRLHSAERRLELTVRDEGRGFDPSRSHGRFGLLGIRERVDLLGGLFALTSAPGKGTEISISIPLTPPDKDDAHVY